MKTNVALASAFSFIFVFSSVTYADHPNEGALTLEAIQAKALSNNREIKAAEQASLASESLRKSQKGAFLPELSIEGGPRTTKFDDVTDSGTPVYGKAEWNLYRGGRDSAELGKAEIETELDKKRLEQVKAKISRESAKLYYEMLYLLESISLKQKALSMNQEQMKMAKAKRNSGLTSEADVLEFELRESTLTSDLKLLEQQKAVKARELGLLLGEPETTNNLAVRGHLESESLAVDKQKALQRYSQSNLEILEAEAQSKISQKDKEIARSSFLPKLDLEAQYGKLANEERVFEETNNYRVFLKLNVPLFSGFQSSNNFSSSQSRAAQKEIEFQNSQVKVRSEIESLFSELSSIDERIKLEARNLSRSENYYKITLSEYKRGVKNSPDVVGASERLIEASIRNLEFRRDFQLTKLRLFELAGAPSQGL